ncbi:hypothetical protein A2625_04965 [candidate division WOR-1 bacterium RIFCSPHIGHO2_01_FULL_53_15]|uniref:Uncharacterized protein n=1 Tax=candidate division WOR-1 bacterium RIFCSPHIGHO2_01_FULL_53_15 TaxID=1802564 RepID=A0A1F4PZX1_UNCSA|nr:MAG: hypothetical protein A2625_04965 [candidate division WOR-1 bacterium RIFCSPHIGHO2_01_FULL_53_15]OGC10844.1 MAG: hypothetical protein A3D23_05185 [candidate division WOR-1 bacterium RIFCSPHIGHO2_02_FULL_53_26]
MPNVDVFEENIAGRIHPSLSAREMAEHFVTAALEAEYGKAFTMSPGFAKMVSTLAEMIVTNPDLRRQALSVASALIKKNRGNQRNRT